MTAIPDQPRDHGGTETTTRRTVLAGAGAVGAAAVLAACSSGSSGGTATSAPPQTADAGGGGATPSQGGGSGTVLGPTSDVPVGGGKVYASQKVVVTQPTAGTFKCFTAVCTHMGCTVGSVSGGTINCPCHGSQYHITDGTVAAGPAPSPLAPEPFKVSGGEITLT
ncbi:Rieske (2Fe-2S) protein [Streptacidiphilus jiangxiensis]|uniref:Cytochrome bc1 complex Rieske iron-sulfur subunit n=1 Tax=Streptacidiphilus jiangxiensis TaxID=235985 RepID=A0A1H7T7Y5_STRJI|nr:Rieske (2Fe-2S) protein [Streptacidiphilus jiangxiensis]SEL80629.1 Ferredoxin subunit of nitrite reductase or a ring-hydroxylating dioxygenase [Streptacidiphilus jiangxiensis]